jgi:hypothetical protein
MLSVPSNRPHFVQIQNEDAVAVYSGREKSQGLVGADAVVFVEIVCVTHAAVAGLAEKYINKGRERKLTAILF